MYISSEPNYSDLKVILLSSYVVNCRLLQKVNEELAEWYFQDGHAVLAACCHLAVENIEVTPRFFFLFSLFNSLFAERPTLTFYIATYNDLVRVLFFQMCELLTKF